MKKVLGLTFVGLLLSTTAFAENVTLTTFYPSPFGAYDRLKLVPRETLGTEEFCKDADDMGFFYYDNGKDKRQEGLYVCQKVGKDKEGKKDIFDWVMISRPLYIKKGEPVLGRVVCLKDDGKLGVCMQNPSFDGTCGCE